MKRFVTALLFAIALLQMIAAFAQNPVSVSILTYIVQDDGTLVPATSASSGDEVFYRLIVRNNGGTTLPAGIVVITAPIPASTAYIEGSATIPEGFSLNQTDTALEWTYTQPFESGAEVTLGYSVNVTTASQRETRPGIVEYRVSLPSGCSGVATIGTRTSTEQYEVRDGWSHKFVAGPGDYLYISVQNQCDHGTVAVSIYKNGTLFKSASSTGAYVIASTSALF